MTTPANELNAALLIEIPKAFPGARLWRNNPLKNVEVTGAGGRKRRISSGIEGQGDLSGWLSVMIGSVRVAIRLEIETKTKNDRMRESQTAFGSALTEAGGVYIVARSLEQCIEDLGRWA